MTDSQRHALIRIRRHRTLGGVCAGMAALLLATALGSGGSVPFTRVQAALQAPQNAPRQPAPVMSYHGAGWLERPGRECEERPDLVIAAMDLRPGSVVADIGCGTGYFARRIAPRVAPEGRVYGVDIQPEFIDMLEALCAAEGIANIVPVLGDATDPRLPAAAVDWMLLVDVYHEFQQPGAMLERMRAALKPDGRVALVEYRLLGETAEHIRTEHRMSVGQVLNEWLSAGFELERLHEFLPSQHLFIFRKAAS